MITVNDRQFILSTLHTLQSGTYYRLVSRRCNDFEKGIWQWMTVS